MASQAQTNQENERHAQAGHERPQAEDYCPAVLDAAPFVKLGVPPDNARTGLRPSEIVNLTTKTIHLEAAVPYIEVKPEGRVLKAKASLRKVPLVGVALAAMKLQAKGFPEYRDRSSRLSADIGAYFTDNGLRETPEHAPQYSLRHSFEDRLTGVEGDAGQNPGLPHGPQVQPAQVRQRAAPAGPSGVAGKDRIFALPSYAVIAPPQPVLWPKAVRSCCLRL
jgi:hypothetical protein